MYACLGCGYIHKKRNIIKRRKDTKGHRAYMCFPHSPPFHGYIIEWKCDKCGHLYYLGKEEDD